MRDYLEQRGQALEARVAELERGNERLRAALQQIADNAQSGETKYHAVPIKQEKRIPLKWRRRIRAGSEVAGWGAIGAGLPAMFVTNDAAIAVVVIAAGYVAGLIFGTLWVAVADYFKEDWEL
jgi:hypothetical protein